MAGWPPGGRGVFASSARKNCRNLAAPAGHRRTRLDGRRSAGRSSAFLERQQVVLAHVLLEKVGPPEETLLRLGRFDHLANLLYMVGLSGDFSPSDLSEPLAFEPYQEASRQRLCGLSKHLRSVARLSAARRRAENRGRAGRISLGRRV